MPALAPPQVAAPRFSGARLRSRRVDARLTRTALAALVGVAQPTYGAWENGLYEPSALRLGALSVVLKCSIDDLFEMPEVTTLT